jgi:hypothetical protein
MGGTYTSLGYNLGQRRSGRLPYANIHDEYDALSERQMEAADQLGFMTSIPASGRRSSTIMGEIGAMQRSGQGAFAGQNAFGAYARMDLKMGKGGSRSMAGNLFGGIAEQLHFAHYIQRGLTPGDALDAMSFDTPGQTNRAVRGMLQGLPENLKRGILRGGYDLTPEEASMANRMHGRRGPEETARPGTPSAINFQTRIPKAQADLGRILDFFEGKSVDGKTFIDINKRLVEANRKLEQTLSRGIKIDGMEDMVGEMMNLADYMADIYERNRTNPAYGGQSGFGASNQFGLLGNFIQELFKIVFGSAGAPATPSGTYSPGYGPANNFGQPRY